MNDYFMSPSQASDRVRELREKMELDHLSPEELDEYKELREMLKEISNDYLSDY